MKAGVASGSVERVLSADEASRYWDERHQRTKGLRSGGDMGYDERTNDLFYALRLGRLIDAIGDKIDLRAPLYVLDAGCGEGWFARAFARFGHRVDAIDLSPTALAKARRLGGGPRYAQSSLAGWRSPYLYDVVYSIDVLFHIMDDQDWESSIRNLAAHVRLAGRMILVDWGEEERRVWSDYQVTRARSSYLRLAEQLGLRDDGFRPYNFRDSKVGLHVFTRWC